MKGGQVEDEETFVMASQANHQPYRRDDKNSDPPGWSFQKMKRQHSESDFVRQPPLQKYLGGQSIG